MLEKLARDINKKASEKLANKARELMRMGRLSGDAIDLLKSKGMLPSTRTVARGIERGSDALSAKYNIRNMSTVSESDILGRVDHFLARSGLPMGNPEYPKIRKILADQLISNNTQSTAFLAPLLEGIGTGAAKYTHLPISGVNTIQNSMPPEIRRKAKKLMVENLDYRDGMDALIRRHEINEGVKMRGVEKTLLSKYMTPQKARKGLGVTSAHSSTNHAGAEIIAKEQMDARQLFGADYRDIPLVRYRGPRVRDNNIIPGEYSLLDHLSAQAKNPSEFLGLSRKWDAEDMDSIVKKKGINTIVRSPLETVKKMLT